jgi:serine/threonine protein kinase
MPAPVEEPAITSARYGAGDLVAGKYLLDRVLGEGGMGSVWLAHNMDLDAAVAIKLVHADVAPREAADRLKREARAEAQIEHRAIVRVFDCGETEHGHPFIVMEHLEGMSFADALDKKGPLSATSAVRILLPIVDGLSAAHEKGIVHRDIKPENIFLARGARHIQPKVVDFGIAKLDRWDPNPAITLQGTVLGSPSYMAPEQARGLDDVDHRADIWALCAVLYEAITGSPPFRGDTYNAILRSIVEDDVTPLTNSRGAVAALWMVLERGLSKDRAQRFQSMRELGSALARFLIAHGVEADVCGDSVATTWGIPGEPQKGSEAPERPSTRVRPVLALVASPLDDTAAGVPSVAPTSTSGLAAPSSRPRERHHGAVLPLLAALVMLAGVVSITWKGTDASASASAATRPHPEGAATLAPQLVADNRGPGSADVAPDRSISVRPVATPTPPARPMATRVHDGAANAARSTRHGWPTAGPSTKPPNISDLRQPEPRDRALARAIDDETLHALGLKAYR